MGIEECKGLIAECRKEFAKQVVGQSALFDSLMTALMTGGHLLLEGLPGLAKTTAAKVFAKISGVSFRRVQFTPDLLPQDITGTLVYEQNTGKFIARKGPIFANVVLADEINRAGAKVQSALLEAMQERQVTLGTATLSLPSPFVVIATENPIDEDGTYALPAAERDRFLMKEVVPYPTADEERAIVNAAMKTSAAGSNNGKSAGITAGTSALDSVNAILNEEAIKMLRVSLGGVVCDEKIVSYIVDIVRTTRIEDSEEAVSVSAEKLSRVVRYVSVGASPRGSIALMQCAKARALISGRAFVLPDDVKAVANSALRHRLSLTYEAVSDNVTADEVISNVLRIVSVP